MSLVFNEKYYQGLHKYRELKDEDIKYIVNVLENEKCDIFDRLKVVHRIGSSSLYATVWEVVLDSKYHLAIKVQNDIEKTLNEIDINMFLNNWSSSFISIYGSLYCQDINLLNENYKGYFLIMQLAIGDLAQYLLQTQVTEIQLIEFIKQIYQAIYILGKNQLYHGDLHIRNIFIVGDKEDKEKKGGKSGRAVIGDFGETKGIDSITSSTSDIYKFNTSLLEFLKENKLENKFRNVVKKLKLVTQEINRFSRILEERYDEWNEKNRNEEGEVNLELLDQFFEENVREVINKALSFLD